MLANPGKAELRKRLLAQRRALRAEEVTEKSATIAARLWELSAFLGAPAVLCYVSHDNEVDTRGILGRLLAEGRRVMVPVTEPGGVMHWAWLENLDALSPGRYGIPEPRPGRRRIAPPPPGAVCLTPGVAFTRDGHRIGYGGGYFDRFLAENDCHALGLAFEMQMVEGLAPEPHDQVMEAVVTEARIHGKGRIAE